MVSIQTLIELADAYKAASGIDSDSTVSHRVFGDTKKLNALRTGSDITLTRFNAAVAWFNANMPVAATPGLAPPTAPQEAAQPPTEDAA